MAAERPKPVTLKFSTVGIEVIENRTWSFCVPFDAVSSLKVGFFFFHSAIMATILFFFFTNWPPALETLRTNRPLPRLHPRL